MKPFSPTQFYGEKYHRCPNYSVVLATDTLCQLVFKSLQFPLREKSKKVIKIKILRKDAKLFENKSLDAIFRLYSTEYDVHWDERIINEHGDYNVVTESHTKIRKMRASKSYVMSPEGQLVQKKRDHGVELVVTLIRERRTGAAAAEELRNADITTM